MSAVLRDPLFWWTLFLVCCGLVLYVLAIRPLIPWLDPDPRLFDRIWYAGSGVTIAWWMMRHRH